MVRVTWSQTFFFTYFFLCRYHWEQENFSNLILKSLALGYPYSTVNLEKGTLSGISIDKFCKTKNKTQNKTHPKKIKITTPKGSQDEVVEVEKMLGSSEGGT